MRSPAPLVAQEATQVSDFQTPPFSSEPPDAALRALMVLACRVLRVPTALAWLAQEDTAFLIDASGQTLPPASHGTAPLFQAVCTALCDHDTPLAIDDIQTSASLLGTQAPAGGDLVACLGIPLKISAETTLGALCLFDTQPRSWTADDGATLQDLADVALAQIASQRRLDEAEQARAAERLLLDATSEGIYGLDLQGQCTFSNKACAHLLGYESPQALLGENMHALIHHTRTDGTPYPMEACTIYQAFQKRESVHIAHDIFWRKDGTSFPAEFWSDPIYREGEVIGAAVTFIDITERLEAEATLYRTEEQRRLALEAGDLGTWDFDLQDGTIYWDERCRSIFGVPQDETIDYDSVIAIMHPDDQSRIDEAVRDALDPATPGVYYEDYRVVWPDGTVRWVSARGQAYFYGDRADRRAVRFVGTVLDVTEGKQAEMALQRAEIRYRFLANTIPQQVWTAHTDGQLHYVNQIVLDYFGRSFEEMIGEGWQHVLHPDDLDRCVERWTHSLHTGDPYEFEFRLLRHDGAYRWHLARAQPQRDTEGRIVQWFGSNTDIHDYLEVQAALRRSEEQRRLALEASDLGTWDFDLLAGTIFWDERCQAICGISGQTTLDYDTALGLVHPDDKAGLDASVKQVIDPATPDHFKQDYRIIWSDGSVRWISARGQVYFDDDGADRRAVRFVGILFDISERKWAENLIQGQKEVLEQIIHDEPLDQVMKQLVRTIETRASDEVLASVLLLDDTGRHLKYCASARLPDAYNQAIDGLAIGPAVGSCGTAAYLKETVIVSDIATDARWAAFRDLAREHRLGACWSVPILSSNNAVLGTFAVYHHRPCAPRPEDLNLIHVMADTASIAIERKRNQDALKELNATLEKRVEDRTAEVRTLASELTRIEQRERKRISQLLHDHLQQRLYGLRIQLRELDRIDEAERAIRLRKIEPLLLESIDITRTLSVELSPPVLNQEGLVAALEWLAEQMKEVHGLTVTLTVSGSEDLEDQDLSVLLFQLVRELLFNIVKHAGVGEAGVVLDLLPEHLLLTITDQGAGFDVEAALRQRKTVGGTGLFTIQERLGLFGGTLDIESAAGQGTRMQIMLPRHTHPPATPEPRTAPQESDGAGILVVDDSDRMQKGYADLIGGADGLWICATAENATDALDALTRRVPDLAIVDVSLPDMSGLELVKRMTEAHPSLPVIMVSGYSNQMFRRNALNAGARDYLEKEKAPDLLIDTIRHLLA